MAKYRFPAVFTKENSGLFAVYFPDIEGCYTSGESLADALKMAEDSLCLMLYDMEETGEKIPQPSSIESVQRSPDDTVMFITCDTEDYRKFYQTE